MHLDLDEENGHILVKPISCNSIIDLTETYSPETKLLLTDSNQIAVLDKTQPLTTCNQAQKKEWS